MSEFERGVTAAKLEEHARHLATINGSIERSAVAMEAVAKEVRDLSVDFKTQIKMAEAARVALAAETERRREELALAATNATTTWSLRSNKASVAYLFIAFVSTAVAIYLSVR